MISFWSKSLWFCRTTPGILEITWTLEFLLGNVASYSLKRLKLVFFYHRKHILAHVSSLSPSGVDKVHKHNSLWDLFFILYFKSRKVTILGTSCITEIV